MKPKIDKKTGRLAVAFYRGHTRAEFGIPQGSDLSRCLGNWCRMNLAEKEFVPEGYRWNKELKQRVHVFPHWEIVRHFCKYDVKLQRLVVPISFAKDVSEVITSNFDVDVREVQLPQYDPRPIALKMKEGVTDRPWQVKLIAKCSEKEPGMKGLAMQTGKGKTYSAIKSMVNLGYASVVIVGGLVDQWIASIKEFTTATDDDVYKIEGFESIARLAKCPQFKPSIFVCSLRTMQLFCKGKKDYDLLPWTFSKFFKEYGIGTKVIDECHLNFHATTMMDLSLNVPYNLYCSATFTQSGRDTMRIFSQIFPRAIQYGMDDYDKYVTTYFYNFSGEVEEKHCSTAKGYNHHKYENEILRSKTKFKAHMQDMFFPIVNQYFVNRFKPGYKMLIFCSSLEFIDAVVKALSKEFPDLRINSYIGGSDNEILQKSDILVSNPMKAGTGLDLKGLISVYNTISLKSPALSPQMLGRLRKIDGMNVIYVDRCDVNLQSHLRHAEERKRMLKSLSEKYTEYNGFTDLRV